MGASWRIYISRLIDIAAVSVEGNEAGNQIGEKPDGHKTVWCGNFICGGSG